MNPANAIAQLLAALNNTFQLSARLSAWLFSYRRPDVVVPDVRGQPWEEASGRLQRSGLRVNSYSGPLRSLPEGAVVLGQVPGPFEETRPGKTIWLRIDLEDSETVRLPRGNDLEANWGEDGQPTSDLGGFTN
jgi:beta-lactam-binding protein with PASTA domain